MKKTTVTITGSDGLGPIAATLLSSYCSKYHSNCTAEYNGREANMKAIMPTVLLFVPDKKEITISCEGDDEDAAIEEIEAFMRSRGIIA